MIEFFILSIGWIALLLFGACLFLAVLSEFFAVLIDGVFGICNFVKRRIFNE